MNITKLKRAVIKEEYVAITGDMLESVILNQFVYWSERCNDFDKFIIEEKERFEKYGNNLAKDEPRIESVFGWIYKKATELKEEIMSTDSEKTINRKLTSLVEKGFLERRNNPKYKYDRTYQYRVNFENVMKAMIERGYVLQDYKIDLSFIVEALKTDKRQIDDSIKKDDEHSKGQIDALKNQIVQLKNQVDVLKNQGVGAIPKTTTEATTETTTEGDKDSGEPLSIPITPIEKFYNLIKSEISEISFKTWIEPLNIHITNEKATIETKDKFITGIIKDRYLDLIEKNFSTIGIIKIDIKEKND